MKLNAVLLLLFFSEHFNKFNILRTYLSSRRFSATEGTSKFTRKLWLTLLECSDAFSTFFVLVRLPFLATFSSCRLTTYVLWFHNLNSSIVQLMLDVITILVSWSRSACLTVLLIVVWQLKSFSSTLKTLAWDFSFWGQACSYLPARYTPCELGVSKSNKHCSSLRRVKCLDE